MGNVEGVTNKYGGSQSPNATHRFRKRNIHCTVSIKLDPLLNNGIKEQSPSNYQEKSA